jgi:hypothetical protein
MLFHCKEYKIQKLYIINKTKINFFNEYITYGIKQLLF